ncbi:MAG: L,D-transpeptidase [Polyangia bacterium]|nr:L,D-transpeptidase [Polyangia bacterium]
MSRPTTASAIFCSVITALSCEGRGADRGGYSDDAASRSLPIAAPPWADARAASRPAVKTRPSAKGTPVLWNETSGLEALGADKVWAFEAGARYPQSEEEARRQGFTVIDLGDEWTPVLFTEHQAGDQEPRPLPYRQRYLDLANDRTDHHGKPLARGASNHLELFGIPPTPSVIRKRFLDAEMRTCLAQVDRESLGSLRTGITAWGFKGAARNAESLEEVARRLVRKHRLAGPEELPRIRGGKALLGRLEAATKRARAVKAALGVLRCEGMLKSRAPWPPGDELWQALSSYERKHMILGQGVLSPEVAREMARDADEADADAFRRVLRERAVHAAQVLEDGSALKLQKTFRRSDGRDEPLPNLVKQVKEATLQALGLTSASAIRSFLTATPAPVLRALKVAVKLPPKPAYYQGKEMDLEVVISRGDIYYDPPIDENGDRRSQPRARLPALTVWLAWEGQRIPLVNWRTTVGGWNDEIKEGQVYLRYKPSKVGERIWRDIIAAPVWIPPPTTPPKEILKGRKVNRDQMGPGHLSAYGLVAAFHLWPQQRGNTVTYVDQGIRSHGSYNYRSIRAGYSHGCHRLYNHQAIRLFSFILRHRAHERVGLEPYPYRHQFEHDGRTYKVQVDNRGYVFRLLRPIPVNVTRGRILGSLTQPISEYLPKPGVVYRPPDDPLGDAPVSPAGTNAQPAEPGVRPMPAPGAPPPPRGVEATPPPMLP